MVAGPEWRSWTKSRFCQDELLRKLRGGWWRVNGHGGALRPSVPVLLSRIATHLCAATMNTVVCLYLF